MKFVHALKQLFLKDSKEPSISKIEAHVAALLPNEKLKVVFGGHWSDNPGWLILSEADQDLCRPLSFPDQAIDVIFTEHVFEHLSFEHGVAFLRQAHAKLKTGGVFRLVCPTTERLLTTSLQDENGRTYVRNALVPIFKKEDEILKSLGLSGVEGDPKTFFLNSLFMHHGHRFIWSAALIKQVMIALGYNDVRTEEIGRGAYLDYCLERRRRGIYMGYDWKEELTAENSYDPESSVIEGRA